MKSNFRQIKAMEQKNKNRLKEINNDLDEGSGIYFLTREDEEGFKYAYIGQAKHILTRLAGHLSGYQHIDLSLKKHGLYSGENRCGWKIGFIHFPEEQLDEKEQHYIKLYALKGYQLRNKTSGSQGTGKKKIDDYKAARGYHDGLKQGRKALARELSNIIEKHLEIGLKESRKNNKISQNALKKFNELVNEENY